MSTLPLLAAILGLVSLDPGALACSCGWPVTLQDAFCRPAPHEYLIQAKVVAKSGVFVHEDMGDVMPYDENFLENFGRIRYIMAVTDVYVLDGASVASTQFYTSFIQAGQNVTFEARIGSSLCGIELSLGTTYVLTGWVGDGQKLSSSFCNYIRGYDSRQQIELPSCSGNTWQDPSIEWNVDFLPRPIDNEPDEEERSADNDAQHPMSLLDLLKQE